MKLYRYEEDFGRMGSLSGVFLADDQDLKWFMGARVWDSDILGKHSEIQITFDSDTVKTLDVSESTVHDLLRVIGKNISGTTPYDYDYQIDEQRDDDSFTTEDEDE